MTIDANGFDRDYYLSHNPDVAAAGIDPYAHYLTFGWREGRNPNEVFNVAYYLEKNPDVAAAGIDPLKHYFDAGAKEGRNPNRFLIQVIILRITPMSPMRVLIRCIITSYSVGMRDGIRVLPLTYANTSRTTRTWRPPE